MKNYRPENGGLHIPNLNFLKIAPVFHMVLAVNQTFL